MCFFFFFEEEFSRYPKSFQDYMVQKPKLKGFNKERTSPIHKSDNLHNHEFEPFFVFLLFRETIYAINRALRHDRVKMVIPTPTLRKIRKQVRDSSDFIT